MKLRNIEKDAIVLLEKENQKRNKNRNRVLTAAAATATILIFSILSIFVGRIEGWQMTHAAFQVGSTAEVIFAHPTRAQYDELKRLNYIEDIEEEYQFGSGGVKRKVEYRCSIMSEEAFEKMLVPVSGKVIGTFPETADEVMVPVSVLEDIGITQPEVGMEIELVYETAGKTVEKYFSLSGYYVEFAGSYYQKERRVLFAEEYLAQTELKDSLPTHLYLKAVADMADRALPDKLIQDITERTDAEQMDKINLYNYQDSKNLLGGEGVMVLSVTAVMLCIFLLIYNVMNISMAQDIHYYGTLKTLGATKRQIRKSILRQTGKAAGKGIVAGAVIAVLLVSFVIRGVIADYYLEGYRDGSSGLIRNHPLLLIPAILIVSFIVFVSISIPFIKMSKMSTVNAQNYKRHKMIVLSLLSVVLSGIVILCSIMTTKGVDQSSKILKQPDFHLSAGPATSYMDVSVEEWIISEEDKEQIEALEGVYQVDAFCGEYGKVSADDEVWGGFTKALKQAQDEEWNAAIVAVNDAYVKRLEKYALKQGTEIDIGLFRRGKSFIVLHYDKLSERQKVESEVYIGKQVEIIDTGENVYSLTFGGYLNRSGGGFPNSGFAKLVHSSDTPYLLVHEKAMEELTFLKSIYDMSVYVEPEYEEETGRWLERWKREKNSTFESVGEISVDIRSENLKEELKQVSIIRIMLYSLSFLLSFMGIMNYINVTALQMIVRRKELAIMECLGMTRKQLRNMLVKEGVIYGSKAAVLLFTAGSAVIAGFQYYIKGFIQWGRFFFPLKEMAVVVVIMYFICILIPMVTYRRLVNTSVIERLRRNS